MKVIGIIVIGIIQLVFLMLTVFPFITRKATQKNIPISRTLLVSTLSYYFCWWCFYEFYFGKGGNFNITEVLAVLVACLTTSCLLSVLYLKIKTPNKDSEDEKPI